MAASILFNLLQRCEFKQAEKYHPDLIHVLLHQGKICHFSVYENLLWKRVFLCLLISGDFMAPSHNTSVQCFGRNNKVTGGVVQRRVLCLLMH